MLDKVKLLLNIGNEEKDDLLTLLIEQATEEAMAYTHNACVEELNTAIIQMVVYNYNRLGTEGVESEGFSGVTYHYSADYPDSIQRILKSKRKIITL